MSWPKDIRETIQRMQFQGSQRMHERVLGDVLDAHAGTRSSGLSFASVLARRRLMWKRLIQIGLAVVVAIVAIVILNPFGDSIAFADVLEYINSPSYAFDLSIQVDNASSTVRGMVLQPGRIRFDDQVGVGKVSAIVDLSSRRSLLIFHQFKSAKFVAFAEEYANTGADQLLKLCSGPIENLWDLQDGTEEDLGQTDIDGVAAHGFRIVNRDDYFRSEITIWAEVRTARPLEVVIISTALKPPHGELTWTLTNFDLDVELDESLFNMEPPAGYTLTDQRRIEDVTPEGQASPEAKKIVEALAFWKDGQEDKAIEMILAVQWDKPIQFAKEPYIFGLTEKDVVRLNQADRETVLAEVMPDCSHIREMCFRLREIAQEAGEAKDYAKAEQHLNAILHWGQVLTRDPEGMLIVQMVGIAMEKLALTRLAETYDQSGQAEKRIEAEQKIQQVDAYHRDLVKPLKGQ